jgi:hypothetical protein
MRGAAVDDGSTSFETTQNFALFWFVGCMLLNRASLFQSRE